MTKSEDFSVSGFCTHVVGTVVYATVRTHSVSHANFSNTISLRDVQTTRTRIPCTLSMCEYTRMAQGVCSAHVISLHLSLSILMFHALSLLFPDGHFETTFLIAQSSSNCIRPKSTVKSTSARAPRSLATWPIPRTPQVMIPRSSTRSVLWTVTRRRSTIRTTNGQTRMMERRRLGGIHTCRMHVDIYESCFFFARGRNHMQNYGLPIQVDDGSCE